MKSGNFFARPKTTIAKNFIHSSTTQSLPPAITEHILAFEQPNTHPVWRLRFLEEAVTQPIIAQLINQFKLRVNILMANVDYIKKQAMGIMILAVDGEKSQLQAAMRHLQQLDIEIEVIGHVANDIIPFV